MPRPHKRRFVRAEPGVTHYKPRGIPIGTLEEVVLSLDEFEALRVADHLGLPQKEAAQRMKVSQPTLHRVLRVARQKVANALVTGKALHIHGGPYELPTKRWFHCLTCQHQWTASFEIERPPNCPQCESLYLRGLTSSEITQKESEK